MKHRESNDVSDFVSVAAAVRSIDPRMMQLVAAIAVRIENRTATVNATKPIIFFIFLLLVVVPFGLPDVVLQHLG